MNGQRLLAALGFALLCSGFLTWQLSRHINKPAPAVPTRNVILAAKNLAAGDALTSASLSLVKMPASTAVAGLFSNAESLSGRVLLVPVTVGEPITAPELVGTDIPATLTASIPNGMRLLSLPLSSISSGNLNQITPGNHVDILVSYHSDAAAALVSSMVLEDVPVLGEPHKQGDGSDKPTVAEAINLLVTPEQAARLTVASSLGRVTLALRNGADKGLSQGLSQVALTPLPASQTSVSLPTHAPHALAAAPHKDTFAVEVLSGGKTTIQTFSGDQP